MTMPTRQRQALSKAVIAYHANKPGGVKTHTVRIRVTSTQFEQINAKADAKGCTVTTLLLNALKL